MLSSKTAAKLIKTMKCKDTEARRVMIAEAIYNELNGFRKDMLKEIEDCTKLHKSLNHTVAVKMLRGFKAYLEAKELYKGFK